MSKANEFSSMESLHQVEGLSSLEVHKRRQKWGFNEVPQKVTSPLLEILKRMWGPVPWLLEAAMIFEFFLGKEIQALVILLLLVFSAVTGEIQEHRAKQAIGYLRQQVQITVRVLRDGYWQDLSARELVPGDIIHAKIGDVIAADLQIIYGAASVSEAAITGESTDITKIRNEKVLSGSTLHHGEILGQVIATGKQSSFGKTADLIRTSEAPGRLQKLLFFIVRYLAYLDIILALVLAVSAFYHGVSWQELLPFLVILFIATIPISMPSSFVVANSLEAKELAKHHILVTGLTGIQEAASLDILLIDKTGTLTDNQPQVTQIVAFDGITQAELLSYAASACDFTSNDSISQAILTKLKEQKLPLPHRLSFTPFDPVNKYSKAKIQQEEQQYDILLGSPTVLLKLAHCSDDFSKQVTKLSNTGARVLAVALNEKCIGLIALADNLRTDAKESILALKDLGIRVMMLTGDTRQTAQAIAQQVELGSHIGTLTDALENPLDFDGFANIYPADKHTIVKKLQKLGLVVGMMGDGINDAPALKQADVGIAVSSATDIAKTAAKIVLTNSSLLAITKVIESGHRVYRRMMTWTITKLARTTELSALLTFGFIFTDFFPVSLSLIVFIVVLNDLVTLTLGTDKAWPAKIPEKWRLPQIAKISAIFAVGWLILGLGLLWYYLTVERLASSQISSLIFLYLIFSAMATILMTRTRDAFWTFAASKWVYGMMSFNILLTILMALFGYCMQAVTYLQIISLVIITVIAMFILDYIKILYYKRTNILGK